MAKTAANPTAGNEPSGHRRFLRILGVSEKTGLPPCTIYRYAAAGKFPKQFKIGARAAAWDEAEIEAWQAKRLAERDKSAA